MNFLSHYHLNRQIRGSDRGPYFAMGVALPDIWVRFSRTRRIRWRAVEASAPATAESRALRDGLLNHAEDDRRFHTLPLFLEWQRTVRRVIAPQGGDAVTDFLAHIAVEIGLDWHLLERDAGLAERYYGDLASCSPETVEKHAGELASVDSAGLADIIDGFVTRRFLQHYIEPDGMARAIGRVFRLTTVRIPPPIDRIRLAVAAAVHTVRPQALWSAMHRA